MSEQQRGRLYGLLPEFYRTRDAEQGEPLRRLLSVMEDELQEIEDDVAGLFENWFIETCEEWVVPYIADLLGVEGLHAGTRDSFSLRAHVANTLAYRRRKGTAAVLEQVANDTTGWRAHVIEAFQHLAVSANVNHPRLESPAVLSVRGIDALQYVGGPFDRTFRSADVRHVASGRGRWNLPHVALWLWRLEVLETRGAEARPLGSGRWTLDPWSWRELDGVQLFNRARTETAIVQLTEPQHVPGPLLRLPLYREVEAVIAGEDVTRAWFPADGQEPVIAVHYLLPGGDRHDSAAWRHAELALGDGLAICHLGEPGEAFPSSVERLRSWLEDHGRSVGVDPVSGRLLFRANLEPTEVRADIATAIPGNLGGGAYASPVDLKLGDEAPSFAAFVTGERRPSAFTDVTHNWVFATLRDALDAWEAHLADWIAQAPEVWRARYDFDGARGVIVIADSRIYDEGALSVTVPWTCRLAIAAGQWSSLLTELAEDIDSAKVVRELSLGGVRPHFRADLATRDRLPGWSDPVGDAVERGSLSVHGIHLEGLLTSGADALGSLRITHCTLAPHVLDSLPSPALHVSGGSESMTMALVRSVVLGVAIDAVVDVTIEACVIDALASNAQAIAAPDATVAICASTIRGETTARTLSSSDSLFTGVIDTKRRQEGCVRFSFVPPGSRTPRRFRCQPDLALGDGAHDDAERARVAARMFPGFTGTTIGDPAYFQLATSSAPEISKGAEDGAEMGVWHHLRQPQRLANLRTSFATYLRVSLEVGEFFAT